MGNQSSRDQQKGAEELLSTWTPQEQACLKQRYTEFLHASGEKEQDAAISKFIAVEKLAQGITNRVPFSFQPELAMALGMFMGDNKNTSFHSFLSAAKNILHHDTVHTFYKVYTLAYERSQCTLQTFVVWLVRTAIPLWFEGSGIAKCTDDLWRQDHEESVIQLMKYLVYREQKRKDRRKRREQEEMAFWTDGSTNKDKEQAQRNEWHEQATQKSRAADESAVTTWITDTPIVLTLFQVTAKYIFFGSVANEDDDTMYEDRVSGALSPAIQKPHGTLYGKGEFSRLLTPYSYFMLTRCLPANARSWSTHERSQRKVTSDVEHQLIFSSRRDGTSWQVFVNRIVNQGAVLLVIKAKDGSLFGGYADEEWKPVTDWYGSSSNFLYRIRYPRDGYNDIEQDQLVMDTWDGSRGSNVHYQYLCWGKQSLPNGLGMGGQFDYSGLWLDSDFLHGHSKAGPLCTTYQSPQLTLNEEFLVDEVEAFLVRPLVREDDDMMEGGGGVFSREQDMDFMEMAGKKMYSRDLPDPPHARDNSDFKDDEQGDEETKSKN